MIFDNLCELDAALSVPAGGDAIASNWIDLNEVREPITGEPLAIVVSFENGTRPTTGTGSFLINVLSSPDKVSTPEGFVACPAYIGMTSPNNPAQQVYPHHYVLPLPNNGNFQSYMTVAIDNSLTVDITVSIRLMPWSMAHNMATMDDVYQTRSVV